MDQTNQNPEFSDTNVRVVEPNRSSTESTEQRMFGAYRNNAEQIRNEPPRPINRMQPVTIDTQNPAVDEDTLPTEPMNGRTLPIPDFIRDRNSQEDYSQNFRNNPNFYTPGMNSSNNSMNSSLMNQNSLPTGAIVNGMNSPEYYSPNYMMNGDHTLYLPTSGNYIGSYRSSMGSPSYSLFDRTPDDIAQNAKDVEYLQQLYPKICHNLRDEINDECDQLEYDGSYMFDEYPDKGTIQRTVDRIYDHVKDREEFQRYLPQSDTSDRSAVTASTFTYDTYYQPNWLNDMINILFLNEMYQRRCRHRCRRSYWF